MQVPMHDHAAEYRCLAAEIDEAVRRVLLSGKPGWGPEVPAFEAEFAAFVGAKHAIGTGGYICTLQLVKDAFGRAAGRPGVEQGGERNRHKAPKKDELVEVEVVDPETGKTHIEYRPAS